MASDTAEASIAETPRLSKREMTAWCLYLLVFGLSIGHQAWLLHAHLTLLVEYKYEPWTMGYVHAVPTYVPAFAFLFVFAIVSLCRPPGSSMWVPAGAGTLAAGTTNLLTYPIQVIIYMCHDIILYLDALPTNATCLCWPEPHLVLQNHARGQVCECYVPYRGVARFAAADGAEITKDALTQIGYPTLNDVIMTQVKAENGTWPGDNINTWDTLSFKTMLLLLQSCVIVTICRLPMYLLFQHLNFSDRHHKVKKDIHRRARGITERPGSGRSVFRRVARLRVEQVRFENNMIREKRVNLHTVIELCYYNFVEGLDAFTLIEDVVHYGDYFKSYPSLTASLLTFVSITVFLVTTSNVLALFPDALGRYRSYTKIIVVFLGNLPFLIIRSYLSYLAGGLQNGRLSTIFIMFVVKEALVLVMGTVEFLMGFYADETDEHTENETWTIKSSLNLLKTKEGILQMFFNRKTEEKDSENNNVRDDVRPGVNCDVKRNVITKSGIENAAFQAESQDSATEVTSVTVISAKQEKCE